MLRQDLATIIECSGSIDLLYEKYLILQITKYEFYWKRTKMFCSTDENILDVVKAGLATAVPAPRNVKLTIKQLESSKK